MRTLDRRTLSLLVREIFMWKFLCVPTNNRHQKAGRQAGRREELWQVKHLFDSNPYLKTLFELVEVTFDWEQLIVAAVVASIVSYLYLFCISLCASLVWLCLIALVVLPTCLGLVYVYMSASPEIIVPNSFPAMITSGDTRNDLTVGLSLCGVGGLLACVAMVKAKTIQAAVVSIEEAADCIRQMPVLAVEPWISVVIKLLFFVPGMLGLLASKSSRDSQRDREQSLLKRFTLDSGL